MHFKRGFSLAIKHYPLFLIAVVFDLLRIRDIMQRYQDFNIKFTIPSSLPSLTQVLPDVATESGFYGSVTLSAIFGGGFFLVVYYLVFLFVNAYLKGGYLGCILVGLRGGDVNIDCFLHNAGKYFSRFLAQSLIFLAAASILGLLILNLGFLSFVFLLVFLAAFFLFALWDYSLVAEDMGVVDAAEKSWHLFLNNPVGIISFLLPILLITGGFSILANYLATTPLVVLAMIVYVFLGTGFIFSLMSYYLEIKDQVE